MKFQKPFTSVIFDFDSTLSALEGVDYLAKLHGVAEQIEAMTREAMNSYSVNKTMYAKRLQMIQPRHEDIAEVSQAYLDNLVPGVTETIRILRKLGKSIYIVSGGIREAILPVGKFLDIPADHIFAVEVYFDDSGRYSHFNTESPMVGRTGKLQLVQSLQLDRPVVFVGDGANDVAVQEYVDRFIGFGGAEYRPAVEQQCDLYIREPNFMAILPYLLTGAELSQSQFSKMHASVDAQIQTKKDYASE